MTIDRVPVSTGQAYVLPTTLLPARSPGSALAVLALADELTAERVEHARTREALTASKIRARGYEGAGRILAAWSLPWLGGGPRPAPDEPLPVDVSVAPLIFDGLVAELVTAEGGRPARRRRGLLAATVLFLLAAVTAAVLTRKAHR